jgi:hypothetical protein
MSTPLHKIDKDACLQYLEDILAQLRQPNAEIQEISIEHGVREREALGEEDPSVRSFVHDGSHTLTLKVKFYSRLTEDVLLLSHGTAPEEMTPEQEKTARRAYKAAGSPYGHEEADMWRWWGEEEK